MCVFARVRVEMLIECARALAGAAVVLARVACAHAGTTFLTQINELVWAFDRDYHLLHPLPRRLPARMFKRDKRHLIIGDTVGTTMFTFLCISLALLEGCDAPCAECVISSRDCAHSIFTPAEYAMWTAFVEVIECMQVPMYVKGGGVRVRGAFVDRTARTASTTRCSRR